VTAPEVFACLLAAVAAFGALAIRLRVPYPVVLVLGGLALAAIPGSPVPKLSPDAVFYGFLPPLLYSAGFLSSTAELRAHARPIATLATGLVLVTLVAVAVVAHAVLGLPWAAAFVLGAILGATDPVAATSVVQRLGARRAGWSASSTSRSCAWAA